MDAPSGEITRLLHDLRNGDRAAENKLMPLVYAELRRRAAQYTFRERPDHTLQPTALVHEAYLRLVKEHDVSWQCRAHFYAIASNAMRHVLVEYARSRRAEKRRGSGIAVPLDEAVVAARERSAEVIALDEALARLAQWDPRQSQIVELRYFGGLSVEETAEVIGISSRQVKREWSLAKAWLHGELKEHA
jgi:RNA polymerase sigma-70 factor (ECF subfamily)